MRTAGDRTRRRRLNKLSCAGWLPHDRSFVSGLPRSKDEHRSGDRLITGQEGSPTVVLSPAVRTSGIFLVVDLLSCVGGFSLPRGIVTVTFAN